LTTTGSSITFPAGTYLIESIGVVNLNLAINEIDTVITRLRTDDSAEDLIAYAESQTTGQSTAPTTFKFLFGFGTVYTFASDTDVKLTFEVTDNGGNDTFTISPIRVERIA